MALSGASPVPRNRARPPQAFTISLGSSPRPGGDTGLVSVRLDGRLAAIPTLKGGWVISPREYLDHAEALEAGGPRK